MNSRKIPFYIVDVFGQEKYSGNQLAVFPKAEGLSQEEMQAIAREINFSETTFVTSVKPQTFEVDTRIFTPGKELPFAGHPTLGTAFIVNNLFFTSQNKQILINVKAGTIPVEFSGEIAWMKQIQPEFAIRMDNRDVAEILELELSDIDTNYPIEMVSTGIPFFLVPVTSLRALQKAVINMAALQKHLGKYSANEFMVFTKDSYNSIDSISARVFVPEYGIMEDPATGSANGCLAAYLIKHKYFETDKVDLSVAQGYEIKRKSRLFLKAEYIDKLYDLRVGGKVIPIAEGWWN